MKRDQAILNINSVSCNPRSDFPTHSKDDKDNYVKLNEVTLPDGKTKMTFFTRKPSETEKTFDEVMKEIFDLASDALVRKLSK